MTNEDTLDFLLKALTICFHYKLLIQVFLMTQDKNVVSFLPVII